MEDPKLACKDLLIYILYQLKPRTNIDIPDRMQFERALDRGVFWQFKISTSIESKWHTIILFYLFILLDEGQKDDWQILTFFDHMQNKNYNKDWFILVHMLN